MPLHGEEEEEMLANSNQEIHQKIWEGKIVLPVSNVGDVYEGNQILIDWQSGIETEIFVRYSTLSGDPLIHVSPGPIFMRQYPGTDSVNTLRSLINVQSVINVQGENFSKKNKRTGRKSSSISVQG